MKRTQKITVRKIVLGLFILAAPWSPAIANADSWASGSSWKSAGDSNRTVKYARIDIVVKDRHQRALNGTATLLGTFVAKDGSRIAFRTKGRTLNPLGQARFFAFFDEPVRLSDITEIERFELSMNGELTPASSTRIGKETKAVEALLSLQGTFYVDSTRISRSEEKALEEENLDWSIPSDDHPLSGRAE